MLKQEKLLRMYEYIKDNFYLCHSDLNIGKDAFNSTLLFGLLTSINKGKQLLMGEYGGGKTTSSEHLLSMIYGIPKRVLISSTLKGNPEITQEKLTGRLNLGELNQGVEKVVWSFFVTLEPKIIDEFNRIPESKQNLLLEGMDRGNWQYLNEMIPNGDIPIFATINYKDSGNTKLVEAAVDRFELAVESKHPGVNNMRLIRQSFSKKSASDKVLEDHETEKKMYSAMLSSKPYHEKRNDIIPLQEAFKKIIEKRAGIELLSSDELALILEEIKRTPVGREADLFLDMLVSEMYSCMKFGQKRSNEECVANCHYQNLLCGKKTNCDSVRTAFAEVKYAKSLAWLLGDKEAGIQHLTAVLPYILWHKMRFLPSYASQFKEDSREDALPLYVTKKAVHDLTQRFSKQKDAQQRMFDLMKAEKFAEAKKLASEVDHPVFRDYLVIN
ncbi:AAA family ATPase [Candidatus Woesearchaeota archaeon]|nr:AAA family ATPase [Candidatus Woesearchaeota archaeon]